MQPISDTGAYATHLAAHKDQSQGDTLHTTVDKHSTSNGQECTSSRMSEDMRASDL